MSAAPEFLRNTPEQERSRVNSNKAEIRRRLPERLEIKLSQNETAVLQGVEQVVDNIDPIWQVQKRTPFYYKDPKNLSEAKRRELEEEIRELGKTNSEILSPYTYAEKRNGTIIAVPYHEKFAEEIGPIVKNIDLTQLIIPTHDYELMAQFYERLTTLKEAFEGDKWEEADKIRFRKDWVNRVEFVIGPFETNFDHFEIKTTVQGLVGVIDEQATRGLDRIVNAASTYVEGKEPPEVDLKVLFVTAATGIVNPSTGEPFKAQVLPNDPRKAKEFGSRGLIFINLLEEHFNNILYPVMRRVFDHGLLVKFTKQGLFEAYRDWIALHEFHHPVNREEVQDERQGSLFLPFHELHCDISALSMAKTLTDHGVLDSDEFEAILIVQIARALNDIYNYHFSDKEFPDPYAKGSRALFNYLAEFAGLRPLREDSKLGLYQEKEVIAAVNNLVGKFNIDAKDADFEETQELFDRFDSGNGYKFAEPLLRDLFEEPRPFLSS